MILEKPTNSAVKNMSSLEPIHPRATSSELAWDQPKECQEAFGS